MSKNTMNGWKVIIRETRESTSSCFKNKFALTYPVNEEVFPKLEGSKLFFFENKEDAEEFTCKFTTEEIVVPCVATNPKKKDGDICAYTADVELYWGIILNPSSELMPWNKRTPPPFGTWLADSITCLE